MNSASSYSSSSEESINKEFLADEDEDVTSKLLDIGDETVDKLNSQGINAEDVKRLKEAGILTCHSLLLLNTKKKLIEIEGLSDDKVDKILEAAEKLVDSVSIFLKEHQMKEQRAETVKSLRSQIQITSDPDPLVRRGAMLDIQDMLKRSPDMVKPHTFAMVRAFQRHIADEDKQNRELSYSVLDALISNDLKEGDLTMALRMLIESVLEALTLPNAMTYVKLSALKFLARLVFRFRSPLMPLEVEKVIENCGMFLMDNQYTVHDKMEIQDSLNSFLTLLPWNRKGTQFIFEEKESDVQDDYLISCYSFCNVIERLKYVVRAIIFWFRQLATAQKSPDGYRNIYGCMASLLEGINLIAVSFTKSKYQDSLDGENINVWDDDVSKSFHHLFQHFPLYRISHPFNELDTNRLLDLNMVIAKIYFQLYETCPPQYCMQYLDNFLGFIGKVLNGKFFKFEESDEAIWGTHLNELVYLVPRLIAYVAEASNNMQSHNLQQAFTHAFMESKLDSKVKLACLYAIEDMLSHMHTRFACLRTKKEKAEYITTILEWMGVYTSLLKQLFPAHSLVAIRVLRSFGQWIREHPSLLEKYDTIQFLLPNLLCKCDERREPYFLCLPTHYENMLFCFMYFSTMEWPLLNLMLKWCISPATDLERILKIIDLLHSCIPTKLKVEDYVKFSITLVSQFKASAASRRLYLKEITSIFCSYMQDNGDYFCDSFREIEKRIVEEIVQEPYLDNAFSLLKILGTKHSEDVTLSKETLLTLNPLLLKYLKDVEELADDGVHQATIMWEKAKQYALENY